MGGGLLWGCVSALGGVCSGGCLLQGGVGCLLQMRGGLLQGRWCLLQGGCVCSRGGVCSGGVCLLRGACLLWGGVCSWGCVCFGGCLLQGVSAPMGCLLWGVSALGGVCSRGCLLWGCVSAPRGCLLWGVCSQGVSASGGSAPGVSAPGGDVLQGVSAPGGLLRGGYPSMHRGRHLPPCEQNDKQVQKYYLGHNFVAAGNERNWIERGQLPKRFNVSYASMIVLTDDQAEV